MSIGVRPGLGTHPPAPSLAKRRGEGHGWDKILLVLSDRLIPSGSKGFLVAALPEMTDATRPTPGPSQTIGEGSNLWVKR